MQQIYKRTPIPKCDFNKFAKQLIILRSGVVVISCGMSGKNSVVTLLKQKQIGFSKKGLKDIGAESSRSYLQLSRSRDFVSNVSQSLTDGTEIEK